MGKTWLSCYVHDCTQAGTHVISVHNPHELDIADNEPRIVCNQHLAYELDIWADVITSAEPGTKQAYVTEVGTTLQITPIP